MYSFSYPVHRVDSSVSITVVVLMDAGGGDNIGEVDELGDNVHGKGLHVSETAQTRRKRVSSVKLPRRGPT